MKDPLSNLSNQLGRRSFLKGAAGTALTIGSLSLLDAAKASATTADADTGRAHIEADVKNRIALARHSEQMPAVDHTNNGDEEAYPNKIGSYHKALPHDAHGEVDLEAYGMLMGAIHSGSFVDFEALKMGGRRRLVSPQAGLAFDDEGLDNRCFAVAPPPKLGSAERAGEFVELGWMAMMRDIDFLAMEGHPMTERACADLNKLSDFRGPRENGKVTPNTLFRGPFRGQLRGPYISQFLYKPVPLGALTIDQRQRTLIPSRDYLTSYEDWLDIQNGTLAGPDVFDETPRYIRNMRDMSQWVHMDALFQSFLNAALILEGYAAPYDLGNPYSISTTQEGFATLGCPYILGLVTDVAGVALRASWYNKWFVHRTLRPEAYGGLVHLTRSGMKEYPVHEDALHSDVVDAFHSQYGTYLLPQAFPEGCPAHPSYLAGHATVAGACVTVLKAVYDEQYTMPRAVVPNDDGTELVRYTGPLADELQIGGELNKLAMNVACGRNMAGIHWRSDFTQSMLLGEEVAIAYLKSKMACLNEPHSYTLSKFDGSIVSI